MHGISCEADRDLFYSIGTVPSLCKGSRFVCATIISWKLTRKWTHPSGETSAVVHPAAPVQSVGIKQVRCGSRRWAIMFASAPALTKLAVSLLQRDAPPSEFQGAVGLDMLLNLVLLLNPIK